MRAPANPSAARHLSRPEALYALAYVGCHISFMPFLVLLLPRRIEAISHTGSDGRLLCLLLLIGGIVASVANIVAGHYSDHAMTRSGNRRATIAIGLGAYLACFAALAVSSQTWVLILGMIGFQIAVNLLFSPMAALLADYVPNHRKGRISGVLNCGLPLANGTVAIIAWIAPHDGLTGFIATAGLTAACILPLLVIWPFGAAQRRAATASYPAADLPLRNLGLNWTARFLLQLGAVVLTSYLYPYLAFLLHGPMAGSGLNIDATVGWLSLCAGVAACLGAIAMGQFSDGLPDRRKTLSACALLGAAALVGLATAQSWLVFAIGFSLFHVALPAFFAIEAALVAEMVMGYPGRGHVLGYMNLANTLPTVLGAVLALQVSARVSLGAMIAPGLLACAAACVVAGLLVLAIRPLWPARTD